MKDLTNRWGRYLIILVILLPLYSWSWDVTGIDLGRLVQDFPKAVPIITSLLQPSILERGSQTESREAELRVPCLEEVTVPLVEDSQVEISSNCLNAGDTLVITGTNLRPNTEGRISWLIQDMGRLRDARIATDDQGNFRVETTIPRLLEENPGDHQVRVDLTWEAGGLSPSEPLRITIDKMIETVFLALMATTLAAFIAVPLSFLGARNIMPNTPFGNTAYYLTRTLFNLTRSIEPLILATIFAIWVGFGPFAGVLALTVSTVANLGKLYSEAAESIDPGPIEAIRATGANPIQIIWYAVLPQITPPYTSFTVYFWDINVRMSTIIGFVGGGGIGMELSRWINQLQWNAAATAVWAIVVVVTIMDYTSAVVRERMV